MAGMFVRIFKSRHHGGALGRVDTLNVQVVAVEGATDKNRPPKVMTADGYDRGLLGVIERMFSGLLIEQGKPAGEAGTRTGSSSESEAPRNVHFTSADLDVLTTIVDPRVDALARGFTGRSAGEKVSIDAVTDPARPHGLLEDSQGLGTDAYGEMPAAENPSKADSESRK